MRHRKPKRILPDSFIFEYVQANGRKNTYNAIAIAATRVAINSQSNDVLYVTVSTNSTLALNTRCEFGDTAESFGSSMYSYDFGLGRISFVLGPSQVLYAASISLGAGIPLIVSRLYGSELP